MKPTYSRVSRWGLIAYASTFDTIGVFSKTVKDNALVMEIMAGHDEFDSTSSRKPVLHYSELLHFDKKVKVAYLKETLESSSLQPEIKENTQAVLEKLKLEGHEVKEVKFPLLKYLLPTYYILTTAEASSNLSRFDGVRYGHRASDYKDLAEMYEKSRAEGFSAEVKRRILIGTYVLSAGFYDAYYNQAQRVRTLIARDFEQAFEKCDVILAPTTPTASFALGDKVDDPLAMYLNDVFAVPASLAGLPAMSVPAGLNSQGLPLGLQLIGKAFD